MKIPFAKLHGAKNDFLITRVEDAPAAGLQEVAIAICDRYTGIGADGWMLLGDSAGDEPSIRLFNSDGSEPELSGNGTRCAAALLAMSHPEQKQFKIRTGAGVKQLYLISRQEQDFVFEMNMGNIRIVELTAVVQGYDAVIVDAGNPQCVFPVSDFDFDWRSVGAATEKDSRFPRRTNVSFIRKIDRHTIEARFWERGAGETNSSGTGSTGAATAAVARGLAESPVTVQTPAGPLVLRLESDVWLRGPVQYVGDGAFYCAKISPTD